MPFTSANLALHHSGASDIGGAIGAVLTKDTLNEIWDNVSSGDASGGDTEYRCAYVKNTHGSLSVANVAVEIGTDPTESNWEIALGAAGRNGTETAVANEDTAPATPTFGTGSISIGKLAAGDSHPIWIKRIVTGGAGAATPDTGVLTICGGVPEDPNLALYYNFLQPTGSVIGAATNQGPDLTYTGNGGTSLIFDENGTLVSTTNDESRYDHDPVTGAPLGILNEEERENLQVNSEAFDNAAWGTANITINADDIAAPDGNTTADRFTDDGSNAAHRVSDSITLAGSTDCAFSVYARAGTKDFVVINYQTSSEDHITAVFDVSSGSTETAATETDVGTTSGTIANTNQEDIGGGWFRCVLVGQTDEANGSFVIGLASAATSNTFSTFGDVTYSGSSETCHFWGSDAEEGSFATSYIPTTTVAVTRTADVLTTTDVTWFNATAGTFVVHGNLPNSTGLAGFMTQIDDGSNSNRITMRLLGNDTFRFATDHASDTDGDSISAGAITPGTVFRCAGAYADDDVRGALDGTLSPADGSAAIPLAAALTTFRLNNDSTGGDEFNGHIAQIKYWNVRKVDDFLQSETV